MGAGMNVVDGMHAEQSWGDWSHVRRCQSISRVRGDTLMTPVSRGAALVRVEPELVELPGKALTRAPQEGLGFLSMQPVGYTQ